MDARLTKQTLGACALGAVALMALASLGTPAQAASTPWSPQADCTACHESQATSVAIPTHEALGCSICHSDADALADVHADVDESSRSPRRLKATDVPDTTCLGCHGDGMIAAPETGQGVGAQKTSDTAEAANSTDAQATPKDAADNADKTVPGTDQKAGDSKASADTSGEKAPDADSDQAADSKAIDGDQAKPGRSALIAATADSTVLTDENGTTVNPHDLPAVEDHASVNCIDCHKGHTDDALEVSAMKACVLCHHENVFECYTCHE